MLLFYFTCLLLHISGCFSTIDGIFISSNYIYAGVMPSITCFSSCSFIAFQHNNSDIDTMSTKYTLTVTSNHAKLVINNTVPSDAGSYRCVYNCSSQVIYSESKTLTYVLPLEFLTQNNITYHKFVGGNVTISCQILHYVQFQWLDMNGNVIEENERIHFQGTNLLINDVQVENANTYRCTATSIVSVHGEIRAILKVYKKPSVEVVGNDTVEALEGGSVSFRCKAVAVPRPKVIWSHGVSFNIGGRIQINEEYPDDFTVSSRLMVANIKVSDDGLYKCTAGTDNGTSSETFQLQVLTPQIVLGDEIFINSTSVIITWKLLNVLMEDSVIVSWRAANSTDNGHFKKLPQNITEFLISFLTPGTSYIVNVSVAGVSMIRIITTDLIESPSLLLNTNQCSCVISESAHTILSSFSLSPSSMIQYSVYSVSIFATSTPTIVNGVVPLYAIIGIGLALFCAATVLVLLTIVVGVVIFIRKKQSEINCQKINKQLSTISDSETTNVLSLNEQSFHFQEMTHNPRFVIEEPCSHFVNEEPALLCGTHSSDVKKHDSYCDGYEEFEMTDNPFYSVDISNNVECNTSQKTMDALETFHLTENNIYESYLMISKIKHHETPRFEIVSEKRGDIKENVNLL